MSLRRVQGCVLFFFFLFFLWSLWMGRAALKPVTRDTSSYLFWLPVRSFLEDSFSRMSSLNFQIYFLFFPSYSCNGNFLLPLIDFSYTFLEKDILMNETATSTLLAAAWYRTSVGVFMTYELFTLHINHSNSLFSWVLRTGQKLHTR